MLTTSQISNRRRPSQGSAGPPTWFHLATEEPWHNPPLSGADGGCSAVAPQQIMGAGYHPNVGPSVLSVIEVADTGGCRGIKKDFCIYESTTKIREQSRGDGCGQYQTEKLKVRHQDHRS